MSILKKLVKGILSEVKTAIDTSSTVSATTPREAVTPVATAASVRTYPTDDAYFATLITESSFPGYTIERNVHPSVFDAGAHPKCYPISYLFKKDGIPVLAVLVMNSNQSRAMISRGTYTILDNNNINYIRFYKGMENKESYVISRIKDNL